MAVALNRSVTIKRRAKVAALKGADAKAAKAAEVIACMKQYVRLTREDAKKVNATFETDWKAELKPFVAAAEAKKKK